MKLYIFRSIRWTIRMLIILSVVFAVMAFTGLLDTGGEQFWKVLFLSRRGGFLIVCLVAIAVVYPRTAFGEVEIAHAGMPPRRLLDDVFDRFGYIYTGKQDDMFVYRAGNVGKKILMQWDDTITVRERDGEIVMEGMKKELFRVASHLRLQLDNDQQ